MKVGISSSSYKKNFARHPHSAPRVLETQVLNVGITLILTHHYLYLRNAAMETLFVGTHLYFIVAKYVQMT